MSLQPLRDELHAHADFAHGALCIGSDDSANPGAYRERTGCRRARLETLGYGTLWYGESAARETFAQAAIFLSATEGLVVASGIANIWVRDPMAMAAGGRSIGEGWPDRFILGLGVSHAPMVATRGHDYARPLSAMRDYLDGMERAPWRGPEAPLPPLVLAALGPRMVELARFRTAGAYPYFTRPTTSFKFASS